MGFRAALALLALAAGPAAAGHPYEALPASTAPLSLQAPLAVGETLEYEIYWGMINVGRSSLRVEKAVRIGTHTALHIVSEARSSSFINNFYKVEDRNEAWLDPETLHSYGYVKRLSEGKYHADEWVLFDAPARRYHGEKRNRKGQVSAFEGTLEYPVIDVLSAIYLIRARGASPGGEIQLDVNTKKNWRMTVKTHKIEKAETPYGRKKCLVVEPMVGEEGLFVAKAGKRMLVWMTQDDLRLPLLLKAEIFIGSITAKLVRRTVR